MIRRHFLAGLALAGIPALPGCGVVLDGRADRREATAEAAYPPEGQLIEVAGRRVHVLIEGRGPDLVLIHGAGGNLRDFTFSLVDRLKRRYRVIAFDRPGLGWTDRIGNSADPDAESPVAQARFLQAAAAQLGVRRPIVLGHSYGGTVALAWALDRPRALSALVLLSAPSLPWEGGLSRHYSINASGIGGATVVPLITAFATPAQARKTIAGIFAPQRAPAGYADHVGVGLTLRRDALRANAVQVNALNRHLSEMSPRYGQIAVPTEIVHGTADRIVGYDRHSARLVPLIRNARLTALPGVGHMPHHSDPAAILAAIDRAARRAGLR